MDKSRIIEAALEKLEKELERQQAANDQAAQGATDGESRAESKWDTQGLEASYLARGYAQQFEALSIQAQELRALEVESFDGKPIGIGALVQLEMNDFDSWYLLLAGCGGMEVDLDGTEITIITPESPLGQTILHKRTGDFFDFRTFSDSKILVVR